MLLPFFFSVAIFNITDSTFSISGERDMRLVFQGHTRSRTIPVPAANLGRNCRGRHGNTGCFVHNGSWTENNGVLTVQFQPTIYLNSALTGSARSDALQHEQHHYQDFRRRATQLQRSLTASIRGRRDPQMNARWAWFLYDICTDSASFHRRLGATVEICMPPSSTRP